MARGIVYLMSTCVDGLVKIGKSGSDNFKQRMADLERDGYHHISVLNREFAIEVDDYDEKEKLLHEIFSKSRVGDSELFSVDINLVEQLMASLEGKVVYPVNEKKEDIFEKATDAVQSSLIPDGIYYLSIKIKGTDKKVEGKMKVEEGKITVLKGATVAPVREITVASWLTLRNKLLIENNTTVEDFECSSPSMAASILTGHHTNGWTSWKNANDEYIDIFRKNIEEE